MVVAGLKWHMSYTAEPTGLTRRECTCRELVASSSVIVLLWMKGLVDLKVGEAERPGFPATCDELRFPRAEILRCDTISRFA